MASSGPSCKVLRACLGPRMFLLDVAHCQRPGAAATKDHTLGTLTQWKPAVSHLEARSLDQGYGRGGREGPFGLLSFWGSQVTLGSWPCPSDLSSVASWLLPVCVSLVFFLTRTLAVRFRV